MGKKSDKFIGDITTLIDDCNTLISSYVGKAKELKEAKALSDKLLAASDAAQTKFLKEKFGMPPEADWPPEVADALSKDPLFNKCCDALNAQAQKVHDLGSQLDKTKRSIVQTRTGMKQKLDAFLANKEKSKNPFKSKKSLPTARAFLQNATTLYNKLDV
jgi:hypothetical protein